MRLTTSSPSCAERHEIGEPKLPGTLWATPGLLRDSFTIAVPVTEYERTTNKMVVYTLWWVLLLKFEVLTVQFLTKCHFSRYSAHVLCSTKMSTIAFVFPNLGTSKARIRAMYLQYQITVPPPQIFSTLYWEQVPENRSNKMFSDMKY